MSPAISTETEQTLVASEDFNRWQDLMNSHLRIGWKIVVDSIRISTNCSRNDHGNTSYSNAFVAVLEREIIKEL